MAALKYLRKLPGNHHKVFWQLNLKKAQQHWEKFPNFSEQLF